ncbi:hypothetical protein EJ08DRAFT_272128 [Tothia fuscella]|uniref:ARID domain-containing protein n=1 Tax=Tothia fuscella TaxID=1048955 RepID=A0A9P4NQ92_9PEZI|nr:hypothetical protein EJ08DRAFT_272128 [Tothia fuscella]
MNAWDTLEPPMFNANNIQQQFHVQQQQQQQQQQHRSQTPQFQVNSVVPAKRGRDDGGAGGGIESRSQTPQQAGGYPPGAFQGGPQQQPGQPLQAPNPYQHLQHGSQNNTPSPTMSNQQFRPPPQPAQQRMQTVSPHPPFPGQQQQQQQPGMGMSPPPDANGRVNTPQQNGQYSMAGQMGGQMAGQMGTGGMNFMPGTSMPQGYNQNYGGAQNMGGSQQSPYPAPQVQLTPNLAMQQAEMHRQQQIKMQQQQQMMQQNRAAAAQHAQQAAAMNRNMMIAQQQNNMSTPTRPQGQPAMNPQQMQQRQQEEHAFLQRVGRYMAQSQRPFEPQPTISGRPLSLFYLFNVVLKGKGSKQVTQLGQWPQVAVALRFPPEQYPSAAMEIKDIFERCLGMWEAATFASMKQTQKKNMEATQQAHMNNMGGASQMSPTNGPTPQMPQQNAQQNAQYMQQLQQKMQSVQQQQQQVGQMTPVQNNASLPPSNGWSTPQSAPAAATPQAVAENRKSISMTRQLEGSPAQAKQPSFATPPPSKALERADSSSKLTNGAVMSAEPWNSTNYKPNTRKLKTSWGGLETDQVTVNIGAEIARLKPDVPDVPEMGNLDIHALSMSLQSGIAGEVRYALDYLVKVSNEQRIYLDLDQCEDLVDILIDCAEEQVELLAEEAPEVSDILDLSSYEDVIRNVKIEVHGLQDIPEAGTLAYRLDRAADRLIAITTIIRNLSFPLPLEKNQFVLAEPLVIKFISNAIRLVGTRMLFVRSHVNTQDFMKDIVVFLSNVADKISLPSREDAESILHFLLSFAPRPCPTTVSPLRFAPYNPHIHPYYPPAIDSLAKLLARDEPNRSFYKHIFLDNIAPSKTKPIHEVYDLLTRTFAFAIAVIPERVSSRAPANQPDTLRLAEARKAPLTQGMLAADILSMLCPPVEVGLATAWLKAEDGWAPSLIRLALLLIRRDVELHNQRVQRGPQGQQMGRPPHQNADEGFSLITPRAFGMIKRLGQKSIDQTLVSSRSKANEHGIDTEHPDSSGELATGGAVKGINLDGANDEADDAEEWDRKISAFEGFNGEIVPKSDFLLGVLFLIGIEQSVLKEVWELAEVWEAA